MMTAHSRRSSPVLSMCSQRGRRSRDPHGVRRGKAARHILNHVDHEIEGHEALTMPIRSTSSSPTRKGMTM